MRIIPLENGKKVRMIIADILDCSTYYELTQFYVENQNNFQSFDDCVFSLALWAIERQRRKET